MFQATSLVTGTGHASFTKSPDGTQDWIVYHAHANPTTFNEDRVIRIQPFTFNSNGTPNFGQPLPPGQLLNVPSVGPDPERPILAGDFQADGLIDASDYNLWRATFGIALLPGVAADGNSSGAADAADYVLWRKSASASTNQLSAVVESPVSLTSLLAPTSTIEPVSAERLVAAMPIAPVHTRHPFSTSLRQSAAVSTDARHRDNALIAWLSSPTARTRQSDDVELTYQEDESQTDDEMAPLLVALDAIFASLAL